MKTILEICVQNGRVLETYIVRRDTDGAIFIQNVLDAERGDPTDTMHIDPLALRPIGLALLAAADRLATASSDIHAGLVRTLSVVSMDPAGLASVAAPASAQVIPWRRPEFQAKHVPGRAREDRVL